jgi:nickel-dependent lactate racemase
MRISVQYCTETTELEVSDGKLIPMNEGSHAPAVSDIAESVAQAIEQPRAFPPLRQAVVPGDHVAIVLDDGIPTPGSVLAPLMECLAGAGVLSRDVRIVQVPRRENGRSVLTPDSVPPGIQLVQHDPRDRTKLSYLASTKSGTRVYLNREIVDADLVVLVGRVDYHPILGYCGTSAEVFPGLADATAQQQFLGRISESVNAKTRTSLRRESDEVAWLLGVQFAVQVVIGGNDEVVNVSAGLWNEVQQQAQRALDRYWRRRVPKRAELVIATIRGEPTSQGFEELGRALENARALAQPGGRIAVLSGLSASPGPALMAARELQNPAKSLEIMTRKPACDTISTWQILQACQQARIYLLSRLDNDLVEDLAIIPLGLIGELQRLVNESASCIVLNDAPFANVNVEDRDADSVG